MRRLIKIATSFLLIALVSTGCGSGSTPLGDLKAPEDLPPSMPDFQGGEIQFSNGYQIKGTVSDLIDPKQTASGYRIYGGAK